MSKKNIVPTVFPSNSTPKRVYYFCVPDLPEWRELFIGHVLGMTYGYFWDKSTGDFNEARGIMSNIVYSGLLNSANDCFCDTVADCILGSDAVKDALDKQNSADSTGNNRGNLTAGIDTNGCNNDNLFGAVLELVNELNAYAVDTFEIIEAETNFVEFIAEFLGAIPVAGDVLALIPNLLDFFQEVGAETYNASFTTVLRDEIACDLFCIYQENCELSLDDIFDYLWSEFSSSAQPQTINEAINAFVAIGVIIDRVTVFGVFMIALAFLKLGDGNLPSVPFVNLPSTNRLRIALAVGATQPNNSWTVLCDPCTGNNWCETFEFAVSAFSAQWDVTGVDAGSGAIYTPAVGYTDAQQRIGTRYYRAVRIESNFAVSATITSVTMNISYTKGNSDNPSIPAIRIVAGSGIEVIEHQNAVNGTYDVTLSGSFSANSVELLVLTSAQNTPTYSGSATINSVVVCGDGLNPYA